MSDDELLEIDDDEVAEFPTLAPAQAVGARVSREPHPSFPDEENVTFLDFIIRVPGDEDNLTILPLVMDNQLADKLGLNPEVTLTRADLDTESEDE